MCLHAASAAAIFKLRQGMNKDGMASWPVLNTKLRFTLAIRTSDRQKRQK